MIVGDPVVIDRGAGIPVVLVHGSLADNRFWLPQMEAFAANHRVLAPSLRHHYPDRWIAGAPHSVAIHAADLLSLLDERAIGPVHLLGHSRGGAVALRVALDSPAAVRTLTLVDPAVAWAEAPTQSPRQAGAASAEEAVAAFVDATNGAGTWQRLKAARRARALDNASSLLAQETEPADTIAPAMLAALAMPALVITGARSPEPYTQTANRLADLLPAARRLTLAGVGHAASAERPAAFNDIVLDFWRTHGGTVPDAMPARE